MESAIGLSTESRGPGLRVHVSPRGVLRLFPAQRLAGPGFRLRRRRRPERRFEIEKEVGDARVEPVHVHIHARPGEDEQRRPQPETAGAMHIESDAVEGAARLDQPGRLPTIEERFPRSGGGGRRREIEGDETVERPHRRNDPEERSSDFPDGQFVMQPIDERHDFGGDGGQKASLDAAEFLTRDRVEKNPVIVRRRRARLRPYADLRRAGMAEIDGVGAHAGRNGFRAAGERCEIERLARMRARKQLWSQEMVEFREKGRGDFP